MAPLTTHQLVPEKPLDSRARFFWLIERINLLKRSDWPPDRYDHHIHELSDLVTQLFLEWLRARGVRDGLVGYRSLVLPYISFRFFITPGVQEVDIFTIPPPERYLFIGFIIDEMPGVYDTPSLRANIGATLKTLLSFLQTMRHRREQ